MPNQIILSCPFCHHRGEYQDGPPGSTVRCHDCGSIFRVPTIGVRKPGTVVKGEQIRAGGGALKKLVVVLLILAILGGGGYFCWLKWGKPVEQADDDPFPNSKFKVGTPPGTLDRFLLSWKEEDLELLLTFCTLADQAKRDDKEFTNRLQSMFAGFRLVNYNIVDYKEVNAYVQLYRVYVDYKDARTGLERKGSMSPRVCLEELPEEPTEEGTEKQPGTTQQPPKKQWRWGVDALSAAVRPED